MQVSAGHFICRPSPSTTLQSSQFAGPEDRSTKFDFAMFDEPSMSMDAGEDGTMAQSQKCKRTAGVSGRYYCCFFSLLTVLVRTIPSLF